MSGEAFDILTAQRRVFESGLKPNERLVALALLDFYSRKAPKPFPSIATLESRTGLCRNAVLAAIRGLEKAGAIGVTRTFGCSSTYDLAPLMSLLPVRETNRFTKGTGSSDEPVHLVTRTGSPEGPPPVLLMHPKDPIEGTQEKEPKLPRSEASAVLAPVRGLKKGNGKWKHRDGLGKIRNAYFACYQQQHGEAPPFDSLDGKALNTLWDKTKGDVDRAIGIVNEAFKSFRRASVTIQQIAKDPAAFAPGSATGSRVQYAPLGALAGLGEP